MCGRFAYYGNGRFGYESLHLPEPPHFENYNITPSQDILAVRTSPLTGHPEYSFLHWGLIPAWSKTEKTKYLLNNARADGIEKKPSFRDPFRHSRCIIPASGFYEWQKLEKRKQPYFIHPVEGEYFLLAGLWDHWQDGHGKTIESCTIITTVANRLMSKIHERMPVILHKEDVYLWLDPNRKENELLSLLSPFADQDMEVYPVNARVNSPKNNDPGCVEPIGSPLTLI